jgi:hypothetical protein
MGAAADAIGNEADSIGASADRIGGVNGFNRSCSGLLKLELIVASTKRTKIVICLPRSFERLRPLIRLGVHRLVHRGNPLQFPSRTRTKAWQKSYLSRSPGSASMSRIVFETIHVSEEGRSFSLKMRSWCHFPICRSRSGYSL